MNASKCRNVTYNNPPSMSCAAEVPHVGPLTFTTTSGSSLSFHVEVPGADSSSSNCNTLP
eukprot:44836-Eustigmatos_ZCMA.PRE.1